MTITELGALLTVIIGFFITLTTIFVKFLEKRDSQWQKFLDDTQRHFEERNNKVVETLDRLIASQEMHGREQAAHHATMIQAIADMRRAKEEKKQEKSDG